MRLLCVTYVSATIELINSDVYYASEPFDVLLNGEVALKQVNTNVFSLFNLTPGTHYEVALKDKKISFDTPTPSETINLYPSDKKDVTEEIQEALDNADTDALIVLHEGIYPIVSLYLRSDETIEIKKGALLQASVNAEDYKILPETFAYKGKQEVLGNWEGLPFPMKEPILFGYHVENVTITGEGTIDGQAQKSSWWENVKKKAYGRPHMLYLNHCQNVTYIGVRLMNSPQWTIHPFFSENIHFYDFMIENPKVSPNTDGLNPQCCDHVDIIGVHFSVGDDCIAIKSGKMALAQKYPVPSQNIVVRNCLMQNGHGGIVLGSEMSAGIKNLTCERCYFDHTDRGLRIKTRRGRGKTAVIDNVEFNHIVMDHVLSPITMNMFYFCDPDGRTEYVWSKLPLPVDDRTPYLGKFVFRNIEAKDCEYCAGYFYGLPEMPIDDVTLENASFTFAENAGEGTPAMMENAETCHKNGFIFRNVKKVTLRNVLMKGQEGERIVASGNDVIADE